MQLKTLVLSALFLPFLLSGFAIASDDPIIVRENAFKGRTYHHVALRVTPDVLLDGKDIANPDIGYRFSEGGLFEIYLSPGIFGKMAQDCSRVIVRMPWTALSVSGSAQKVKVKKALFEEIERIRRREQAQVVIALELDPYLSGNRAEGYEMTQCLAFFRTAFGAYIAYPGALR